MRNNGAPLIGLCGYARSGKDTVGEWLVAFHGYKRIGLADGVRDSLWALDPYVAGGRRLQDIIREVGWEQAKVRFPEVRALLQRMGTEAVRNIIGEDAWLRVAESKLSGRDVITDLRFKNEADFVRGHGGIVVQVTRPGVGPVNAHASDRIDIDPDFTIDNGGSIDDLYCALGEILLNYVV